MLSRVQLFMMPWTIACQAFLPVGFPRKEYWNGWETTEDWTRQNISLKYLRLSLYFPCISLKYLRLSVYFPCIPCLLLYNWTDLQVRKACPTQDQDVWHNFQSLVVNWSLGGRQLPMSLQTGASELDCPLEITEISGWLQLEISRDLVAL